jgi:hypothetical protein
VGVAFLWLFRACIVPANDQPNAGVPQDFLKGGSNEDTH